MKRLKRLGLVLISVMLSTRCTDVVQAKLDQGSELIVIDAFLESYLDGQAIFIHKNAAYFNTEKPEPITNAHVKLYDLTDNTSYDFYYAREDRYELMTQHESFVPGHLYKLDVTIDGSTYSAMTTEPRSARIDSISTTGFTKNQITGAPVPLYYMCYLWAKDKADNTPDYYWIKSSRDSAFMNLCIDGTAGIVKDAGQDSIYFMPPYSLFGLATFAPGSGVGVQIHAITRSTYEFLVQAQAQINNGGLFATTPENVKTNFAGPSDASRKAVGWFSIATVVTAYKILPN